MGDAERDPLLGKLHALERQLAQVTTAFGAHAPDAITALF